MILLNRPVLDRFVRKHTDVRAWIEEWCRIVEAADWQSLNDVRSTYPSADGVKLRSGSVVTVFNVKGNEYRLLTAIQYRAQAVYVLDAMTHAEYDKEQWKKRL